VRDTGIARLEEIERAIERPLSLPSRAGYEEG
jgi:hypothetical protein